MSIQAKTEKKPLRREFSEWDHTSYLGRIMTMCPECGSHDVRPEWDEAGYKFIFCGGCHEKFLVELPLGDVVKNQYARLKSPDILNRSTPMTPEKMQISPTPLIPTQTQGRIDVEWYNVHLAGKTIDQLTPAELCRVEEDRLIYLRSKLSNPDAQILMPVRECSDESDRSKMDGSLIIANLLLRLKTHEEVSQEFRRVTTIDLKDLRKKVGYLEEDLRRKNNVAEHWNSSLMRAAGIKSFDPSQLTAIKTTYKGPNPTSPHCDPFKYECLPCDCESCPAAFETKEENPHCEACAAVQRQQCKVCLYREGKSTMRSLPKDKQSD